MSIKTNKTSNDDCRQLLDLVESMTASNTKSSSDSLATYKEMFHALEQVAANCSLKVGMQKCIYKRGGQKQIR